jgi:DNA-directed RNA polymerase subunit RPC12/RpoP
MKDYLLCIKCGEEFRNGELSVLRNKIEANCSHSNLEHGYASNPPKSKCIDCGKFFLTHEI